MSDGRRKDVTITPRPLELEVELLLAVPHRALEDALDDAHHVRVLGPQVPDAEDAVLDAVEQRLGVLVVPPVGERADDGVCLASVQVYLLTRPF